MISSIRLVLSCLAMTAPAIVATAAPTITSAAAPYPKIGSVERLDPALDALLAPGAAIEQLADGFSWSEGPAWMADKQQLVFSDVPQNIVYRWREGAGVDVFLTPSGFTGAKYEGRERGSNGLTLDSKGNLVLCQHGDRRVARLNPDGRTFTTLVDRFEGKRFNSPNDLCFDHAGNLFFTDPPYGMQTGAKQEIDFCGVYRLGTDGKLTVISRAMSRPNGVALSPDERTLYVGSTDDAAPVIMAFPLHADGTAGEGRVFWDSSDLIKKTGRHGGMDGMRIDEYGNLWTAGPGGILILGPAGRHLGTILTGRATANCCFGGPDGSTLFITANNLLLRIATKTKAAAH